MTTQLKGLVRMAGDAGRGVDVTIHLEEETLTLAVPGGSEIGTWSLGDVGIASKPDGFHLRVEGEEVVLNTDDDAEFALAIGIATPTNRLARQMARLRDERTRTDLMVESTPAVALPPIEPAPPFTSRRASRLAGGMPYLGPLVVIAATAAFVASIVAVASGSAISFPGDVPGWPAMVVTALVMGAGGFSAYQHTSKGRPAIAAGVALGLVTILLTAGRMEAEGLAEEALLVFTTAVVAAGVLIAIDTTGRNAAD